MLNDRNDKHEGHEESEYHFSDEEVSYELEPESPKPTPPGGNGEGGKNKLVQKLAQNKRILITGVVVVALIFVFYKFLTPSVPSTDITPVSQQNVATGMMNANQMKPAMPNVAAVVPPVAPSPSYITATTNQTLPASAPVVAQSPTNMQAAPSMAPTTAVPVVATMPNTMPAMQNNQQMVMQQPQSQSQPSSYPMQQPAMQQPVVTVQSASYQPSNPVATSGYAAQLPNNYEAAAGGLNAQSNVAVSQMQAEYVQRLSDFAVQNKALQQEVQTLNSRVSSLESELTTMTHTLMRQYQGQNSSQNSNSNSNSNSNPNAAYPNNGANPGPTSQLAQPEAKSPYNVQAIIPGRAWLRAENGETLTVTEGDLIKDLGRVSKIDPYDGVVEINTGTKVISLAYGNGG